MHAISYGPYGHTGGGVLMWAVGAFSLGARHLAREGLAMLGLVCCKNLQAGWPQLSWRVAVFYGRTVMTAALQ